MTDTELNVIAALAQIGLISIPSTTLRQLVQRLFQTM